MRCSFVLFAALAAACAEVQAPPRIFVANVPQGVKASREEGDTIRMTRWDMAPSPGLTRGYWIVRSAMEWRNLWPGVETDHVPILPTDHDFARDMLIVAAPTDLDASGAKLHQVIDTPEVGLHIYASQFLPGKGCPSPRKDERVPVDLAWIPNVQKEIHFHIDTKSEEACSPPSEAKIACRVDGTGDEYTEKPTAEPGKVVSCLSQGKLGGRATIDRTWSFRGHPGGTTSRMTIAEGGGGVSFGTDAYGIYSIGLDVTDDLGRVARGTTDVSVLPPKDALVVQMIWTHFQPEDDPTTFPRVELHLVGEKLPPPPPPGKTSIPVAAHQQPWILVHGDCAVDADTKPPPWCRARTLAQTTVEEASLEAFPLYRIGVHYQDDRYAGQPVLCVRTFRGEQAAEWCDDKVRSAGSWWDVATVDTTTGKVPAPPPPPTPAPVPTVTTSLGTRLPPAGSAPPHAPSSPGTSSAVPSASAAPSGSASPPSASSPSASSPSAPPLPAGSAAKPQAKPAKGSPDPWVP